jgi:hypothetical protein
MTDRRITEMAGSLRRIGRAMAAATDATRLATHQWLTEFGRQWEHPDLILTDDEIESIRARQLGRTLAEIDELPMAGPPGSEGSLTP